MEKGITKINTVFTFLIYGAAALLFYFAMYYALPNMNQIIGGHVSLGYYVSAGLVFVLLFFSALYGVKREGYTSKEIFKRLRIKTLDTTDWLWTITGILIISIFTGLIFYLQKTFINDFTSSPPFFKMSTLLPGQRWTLLIWLAVFFFNIVGEEILWRGFILPGQELRFKQKAWILNSLGWCLFHISFGINMILMLLPILILLPFIVQKRGNTTIGIIMHAVLNGPAFVMIALGII